MLTSGLIGYWPFNGTVADASGNGNDLGLFGDATLVSGGLFGGGALSLDGVQGSYAQALTNNTQFDLAGDFTVQIWARFNNITNGREETLIEKFSGASGPGWSLTLVGGNDIRLGFGVDGGGLLNSGSEPIPNGVWQEFVVERSGNTFSAFWDGNLVASATTTGPIDDPSSNSLLIGARDAQDGRNFTVDGLIDNVAIWDRALTPAEIAQTWNNGAGEQPIAAAAPSLFRQTVLFSGDDLFGNASLWSTDGRAANTREFTGIGGAYGAGLSPSDLTVFNGEVLFSGYDTSGFNGLWVTDGTVAGTHEVTGISGPNQSGLFVNSSDPEFAVCNGGVLFLGQDQNYANGGSLWVTNGTAAGTHELSSTEGIFQDLDPDFTAHNGQVVFEAFGLGGNGLWVSDGTEPGTHELTGISGANPNLDASNFAVFNGQVLFSGLDSTDGNYSLWITDGTAGGTHELTGISGAFSGGIFVDVLNNYGHKPLNFAVLNGQALFDGLNTSSIVGLWVTNGTAAGTHELTGIRGAYSGGLFFDSSPPDFTTFNGEVLFTGTDAVDKTGLWVTNGTAAGTQEIAGISGANIHGIDPSNLTDYNGEVLFDGLDANGNHGLWFTDGTAAGTYELSGISGGYAGGLAPSSFAILDQPIPPPDNFTGSNASDILFRNDSTGDVWLEAMSNGAFASWQQIGGSNTSYAVVATGDFDTDGTADILYRNNSTADLWFESISNGAFAGWHHISGLGSSYSVLGVGDFYGNGDADILFRNNSTGDSWFEAISNGAITDGHQIGGSDTHYVVVGIGDFFGTGPSDILYRNNSTGDTRFEAFNGAYAGWHQVGGSDTHYSVAGIGNFFGNNTSDILFRNNSTGDTWFEAMSNGASAGWYQVGGSNTSYSLVGVGDYSGSGTDSILFRNNSTGDTWIETISNGAFNGWQQVGGSNTSYTVKG
jgi:ELWxxDGT repeat protein